MQPSVGGVRGGSATERVVGRRSPFVFSGSVCKQRMERRPKVTRKATVNGAQFLQPSDSVLPHGWKGFL